MASIDGPVDRFIVRTIEVLFDLVGRFESVFAFLNALLPQALQGSRKALLWLTALGSDAILEAVKMASFVFHWTPTEAAWWSQELLLIQAALTAVVALWTHQIAKEDAALKTGLPPPTNGPIVEHELGFRKP